MLANGDTIGMPLSEFAIVVPNGGVTALMAVKSIKAGTAMVHPVNFVVAGPAVVSAYITPDSSSSTVGQFAMKYQVSTN